MSVKLIARVWAHSQRKDGELLVMLALADFANDASESWPSIPVLAAKARLTERQTRRVLIKLEEAGEIRRVKSNGGRNRRNHYFITLSENPDNFTLKELQGKNTSVKKYTGIGDTKTLTPMSGALNRHRTVNKRESTESAKPIPGSLSYSTPKKRNRSAPAIPPEFQPALSRVVSKINELAGTSYKPDSKIVLKGLLPRLAGGATESDCILVAEDRWGEWGEKPEMRQHFNPETLFRESNFEKYLNAARMAGRIGNGHAKVTEVKDLGDGWLEVHGMKISQKDFDRRWKTA